MSLVAVVRSPEQIIDHGDNRSADSVNYSLGDSCSVLPDIYQEQNNLVIWQRTLSKDLLEHIAQCIEQNPRLNVEKAIIASSISDDLSMALAPLGFNGDLIENIGSLVDMFCCLFDLKRAGLRLKVLEQAMCPRFHVDWVPCRLVTSFCGPGTQWLTNEAVDRTKLGTGNNGLSDDQSGIYVDDRSIQAMTSGDVALLKGEGWFENEGAGLVHRSPPNSANEKRLLLTLDFIS
ncbi:DUF1826 domain-containing protein [Paraglaciecola polaris]|uniref:Succinylglutamate desuccinylase n=1 Tax=Paraglaciecola polaris LMG 21857 TaxID=1129793 RepID=K6ZFZ4_9ALTE|nr:DUF1826 domain-containing protein [Paraglaciecola polaris]GAC34971.1 hypothetical protein GPLA_4092 [Paraglaciecola polaris LMG 21857]